MHTIREYLSLDERERAAMRCYVFTHFGPEILIPEEYIDENDD